MQLRTLLSVLMVLSLLAGGGFAAARKTTKRPVRSSAVKTSASKKATSAKSSRSKRKVVRRSRSATQRQPTADRYKEIQQALADKGHYAGPIDGNWGPECVDALKRFQEAENLPPDGKLGALSLIAMGLGPKRDPSNQFATKPEVDQ